MKPSINHYKEPIFNIDSKKFSLPIQCYEMRLTVSDNFVNIKMEREDPECPRPESRRSGFKLCDLG